MRHALLAAAALLLGAQAPAPAPAPAPPAPRGPGVVLADAPATAWREVAPENLMVMTLSGNRRVLIELAPDFAPAHVANLRLLLAGRWFDGLAIVRVQDNYVTQWGDPTEKKPLPPAAAARLAPEWERPAAGLAIAPIPGPDGYGDPGYADGWPVARRGGKAWLVHCYGTVGVGRGEAPDSGNASELYAVNGHAPRNLDRNYTPVGRVVDGMQHLASLRRGTGPLGFYERAVERTPVINARLASDLPAATRPRVEVLRSDTQTFADYVAARAARPDFLNSPGFVDLCAIRMPARLIPMANTVAK